MKILNFGSLNIDYVYEMDHFVEAGETASCKNKKIYCGGKGLNQSVALAKAGATVYHAGKIGKDGIELKKNLEKEGVKTNFINIANSSSGCAIIQVNKEGENCIIVYGGTNQLIEEKEILETITYFSKGDVLLIQNEVNNLETIIKEAKKAKMKIVFNPAPMNNKVKKLPLELIDILVINEVEGEQLTGLKTPESILKYLLKNNMGKSVVLTLGAEGVMYHSSLETFKLKASKGIKVKDTTAAGDTFIGYFLSSLLGNKSMEESLFIAKTASEICISRSGAAISIPDLQEVMNNIRACSF